MALARRGEPTGLNATTESRHDARALIGALELTIGSRRVRGQSTLEGPKSSTCQIEVFALPS